MLSAAASLKQCGHQVFVAAEKDAVAKKAKCIEKYIEFDKSSTESVGQRLIALCVKERIDVIIPMEDDYADLLSRYKDQIEKHQSSGFCHTNLIMYVEKWS